MAATLFLHNHWHVFILLPIEHARIAPGDTAVFPMDLYDYPYSHSLLLAVVWSIAGGIAACFGLGRQRLVSVVIAFGIFSHWVLDWITHRPDLALYPGSPIRLGLGLWNSVPATVAVEGSVFVAGVAAYARCTRRSRPGGSVAFWAFVGFLSVAYVANLVGPPPPSVTAVGIVGIVSTVVFLAWIAWFDRRREAWARS
jgi:hypothetical protein